MSIIGSNAIILTSNNQPVFNTNQPTAITENAKAELVTTGGPQYGGQELITRAARNLEMAKARNANLDTLFAFFIDLVGNPSKILAKDPLALEHMESDLQIKSCMTLLKLSVSMQKRQWIPSEKDKSGKIAKQFEKWFDKMYQPTNFLNNLLEAIWRGHAFAELTWKKGEDGWYIERAWDVHGDRFTFNKLGQLCLKHRGNVYFGDFVNYKEGKPIVTDPLQFISHIYNPVGGSWNDPQMEAQQYWGRGIMENVFPSYYAKVVITNNLLQFIEFLAGGKVAVRYPGNQTGAQDLALEAGTGLKDGMALAIPSGANGNERIWDMQFFAGPANPGQIFNEVIAYYDKQMAKMILGTAMVNDSGSIGTQSSPEIQVPATLGRNIRYQSVCLEESLNRQLVPCYGHANGIPEDMWPTFSFATSLALEANKISQVLQAVSDLGFKLSEEIITEYLGLRGIKEGEKELEPVNPNPNDAGAFGAAGKANEKSGTSKAKKTGRGRD